MAFDENIRVRMELIDKTTATLQKISKNLEKTQQKFDNLERSMRKTAATQRKAVNVQRQSTKAVQETSFSVRELIVDLGALALAYKGLEMAKRFAQTSDEFVSAKARLSIVSDDPDLLFDNIYQMSQEVRTNFIEMAGTVAKMGINVGVGEGQWFKNTNQLVRFNELLAKTFKTGGQNNKEIAAGMLQLTQAMSSGRLQGDEFRSMFENAPLYISYIGEYMAEVDGHMDQFGNTIAYTAGELKQLAAEGKITTDIMINAMMTGADKIEDQFERLPIKIEEAFGMMGNMLKYQAKSLYDQVNQIINTGAFMAFLDQLSGQLTFIIGLITLGLKAASPIINTLLATWGLWSPIAFAIGAGLAFVIAKLVLVQLGVTRAAIATKEAAVVQETLRTKLKATRVAQDMLHRSTQLYTIALKRNREAKKGVVEATTKQSLAYGQQAFMLRVHLDTSKIYKKLLESETFMLIANTQATMANTIATKLNTFATNHERFAKIINIVLSKLHIAGLTGEAIAYGLATKAAWAFNFAVSYLALPLTVGLGILWAIIKVMNLWSGTSYTLTGVLMGTLNLAIAALTNGLIDLYNAGIAVYNLFAKNDKEYKARISYTQSWKSGLSYGNIGSLDYTATGNELAGIKGNTDKIVDNTSTSAEEMKFLREMAEDRVASRLSNVNVSIVNNNDMKVSSDYDIDGIVTKITVGLEEALNSGASGVHT